MNNTVRTHPRTLAEAFPCDHADPIERPVRTPLRDKAVNVALAVAILALILIVAFQGVPK